MNPAKRIRRVSVLLLVLLSWPLPLEGVVPSQVNFQGLLLDDLGAPVNGSVALDFALYPSLVGGTALWSESHPLVPVTDGLYEVVLGSVTPLTPDLLSSGLVFLEISVDSELLTPRQQFLSVPYALGAGNVGDLSATTLEQFFDVADSDGVGGNNGSFFEGTADVDGDGRQNFADADNDGDGLDDGEELSQGSDPNLVTPSISGYAPPTSDGFTPSAITVSGDGFDPGMTVVFGTETPTPQNLTTASFDVNLGPQPEGSAGVLLTNPNGETVADSYPFFLVAPEITSFSPPTSDGFTPSTIDVLGTGFLPGLTVDFGAESPAPQNLTSTSFQVNVAALPAPGSASVVVTNPNGKSTSTSYPFFFEQPVITGYVPSAAAFDGTTTVTVNGSGFDPAMTVTFGSETPTPQNATDTSFQVDVGPQAVGFPTVTVTHPNGNMGVDSSFQFVSQRLVFVTSTTQTGDFGGLAAGDAICAARASAAGLPGTYLAWLAQGATAPVNRFTQADAYLRLDSQPIATSFAGLLDGTLDNPIQVDEFGATVSASDPVWTGVTASGFSTSPRCGDWTDPGASGRVGVAGATNSTWSVDVTRACNLTARLYCFEQ